jgi:hypothetical protein
MMSDDSTTDTVVRTDEGASIEATLKRGEGTRDEDRIKIKGKDRTVDGAIAKFEQLLEKYERQYADRVGAIQPDGTFDDTADEIGDFEPSDDL